MHSEAMWSKLDYKPILLHSQSKDMYIVYWGGIGMTHGQALSIAGEHLLKVFPCPKVKEALYEDFRKTFCAWGFQTEAWLLVGAMGGAMDHYRYLNTMVTKHIATHKSQFDSLDRRDILRWFNKENAIVVE